MAIPVVQAKNFSHAWLVSLKPHMQSIRRTYRLCLCNLFWIWPFLTIFTAVTKVSCLVDCGGLLTSLPASALVFLILSSQHPEGPFKMSNHVMPLFRILQWLLPFTKNKSQSTCYIIGAQKYLFTEWSAKSNPLKCIFFYFILLTFYVSFWLLSPLSWTLSSSICSYFFFSLWLVVCLLHGFTSNMNCPINLC